MKLLAHKYDVVQDETAKTTANLWVRGFYLSSITKNAWGKPIYLILSQELLRFPN